MRDAWQTPHGARPNREGMDDGASRFPCVPARCAKLPGRSLEPISNDRPRGMTVSGGNAVQNSAYRFDITLRPLRSKTIVGAFNFSSPRLDRFFLRASASPRCAFVFRITAMTRDVGDYGDFLPPPGLFHFLMQIKHLAWIDAWASLAPRLGDPCVTLG